MLITLKNDNLELTVDTFGAEAVNLMCNGIRYLRQKDEVWNRTAPILWPIVGRLKDDYTIINQKRYSMPQHGILRNREFKVFKKEDNKLVLIDDSDISTKAMFPFDYQAVVTYTLKEKEVTLEIDIVNCDASLFRYNIGGHPGLVCPLYDNEEFSDYRIVFNKKETFDSPSVKEATLDFTESSYSFKNIDEINLDYKYFMIDAIINKDIKSTSLKLLNKQDKGIEFTWNGFNTMAFWTIPQNKYICFEPWKGFADKYQTNHEFDTKDDLITLLPGESNKVSYTIKILD